MKTKYPLPGETWNKKSANNNIRIIKRDKNRERSVIISQDGSYFWRLYFRSVLLDYDFNEGRQQ